MSERAVPDDIKSDTAEGFGMFASLHERSRRLEGQVGQEDATAVNLYATADAVDWAKEFMRLFGHRLAEIDEALMVGWFANAIMTGWDHGQRRQASNLRRRISEEVARFVEEIS